LSVPREASSLLHYVRTSPVESLYVEANEPSLETRRSKRGEFSTCPLTAQFISGTIEIEEIYGHTTNDKLVVNK
jgi:Tat protein secretion system quality control protein TatD with DNase activity